MNWLKNFFIAIIILVFTNHAAQINADPFSGSMTRKGSIDGGSLAVALLSSFLIGNAVAWAMGAYPKDFPREPYSKQETEMIKDLTIELEEYPDDADIRVELGELYFFHNDLDKAQLQLGQAVDLEPENGEALAIYSANEAKQAGAMFDLTWGLMKLDRMDDAVSGLNRAVNIDPDNFKIRLYRMNTLVGFKNRKGNFHKVFEDEKWFLDRQEKSPSLFPEEVNRSFYQALTEVYSVDAELTDSPNQKEASLKKSETYRVMSTPIATGN